MVFVAKEKERQVFKMAFSFNESYIKPNSPETLLLQAKASTTYNVGDALNFTGGVLEKATGTTAPTHICAAYYVAPATGMKKIAVIPVNSGQLYKTTFAADATAVTEGSKVTIHTDAAQVTATTTSGVATIVKKYGTGASGTACLVKF